jgi:phosphatidate cytidylyltransferase
MTDSPAPPPNSDLSTRFAAGIAMAAVACLAIWFGGWPFRLLAAAAAVVMMIEWVAIHKAPRHWAIVGGILLVALLLGVIEYYYPNALPPLDDESAIAIGLDDFDPVLWVWGGIAIVGALLGVFARRAAIGWGFVYIAVPSFALLVLSWAYMGLVFWVMVVTWATDIFAYFAGRAIGGPKLAPAVSPNKTWAGLIGGVIGAGLAGWGISVLFDLGAPFHWVGAPMAVLAQAGDLYESWVKRRNGVKDSGTILPGHGGVLDRLDGLLAVAFATMIVLLAGLWTG